jgi:hypothetical protein
MIERDSNRPSTPSRVVGALCELIAALDRRVPCIEQTGERQIAKDAALLRSAAVRRIHGLLVEAEHHRYDQELVEAIMTDDGAPWPGSARKVDHDQAVDSDAPDHVVRVHYHAS